MGLADLGRSMAPDPFVGLKLAKPAEWALFSQLDVDNSGGLDKDELWIALSAGGNGDSATQLIEMVDTNGDGLVDFSEFIQAFDDVAGFAALVGGIRDVAAAQAGGQPADAVAQAGGEVQAVGAEEPEASSVVPARVPPLQPAASPDLPMPVNHSWPEAQADVEDSTRYKDADSSLSVGSAAGGRCAPAPAAAVALGAAGARDGLMSTLQQSVESFVHIQVRRPAAPSLSPSPLETISAAVARPEPTCVPVQAHLDPEARAQCLEEMEKLRQDIERCFAIDCLCTHDEAFVRARFLQLN